MRLGLGPERWARALFGEAPSRVVVSVRPEHVAPVVERARAAGVPAKELGAVGGDTLAIDACTVPVAAIRRARESCLEGIVGT